MLPYAYKKFVNQKVKNAFTLPPDFVTKRVEDELTLLEEESKNTHSNRTGNYWRGQYLLTSLLAKRVNKNAVISDYGSNGNMLISYLLGLSEIIPLPSFYYCPQCGHHELAPEAYISGYSLPPKWCPSCNAKLRGLGIDIPLNINSINISSSLGLRVSKIFLKKNHLDIAGSFKSKIQRREHQSFSLIIGGASVEFFESLELSIIEKMVQENHIDIIDIDYNDPHVFATILGPNKFGLAIIATSLFERAYQLTKKPLKNFDDLIRLMGFYLGPSSNIDKMETYAKNHHGLDLVRLPTNRDDANTILLNYGIDNHHAGTIDNSVINKLIELTNGRENKEELLQLIDYLTITMYLERKSAVLVKTLLVYRLAYLKTYYQDIFVQAIDQLGYSKTSKIELKRAIANVKLSSKNLGENISDKQLVKLVAHQFNGYVDFQEESIIMKIFSLK